MQGCQVFGKRWTLDIFHHDEWLAVDAIEVEDLDDVRVAQFGDRARLELEAFPGAGIVFHAVTQNLDRDLTLESSMRA